MFTLIIKTKMKAKPLIKRYETEIEALMAQNLCLKSGFIAEYRPDQAVQPRPLLAVDTHRWVVAVYSRTWMKPIKFYNREAKAWEIVGWEKQTEYVDKDSYNKPNAKAWLTEFDSSMKAEEFIQKLEKKGYEVRLKL